MAPVLGIDFGTSNSAAAWVDGGGKVRVCAIREGSSLLPSVAWYGPRGHALVGHPARQQIVDDPTNTVFGFKRFLGRRFASPFVHRHKDAFAYPIVEDERGGCAVAIRGEVKPLEDVAVDVLQRLLELAAAHVGEKIEEVVLTAPAHYGFAQRAVLRQAARRAGVRVKGMINEPTAASVYYARSHPGVDRTILVFDLGGGTFDATLLAIVSGVVKVIASGGDAFLGGADFDAAIVDHLVDRFRVRTGVELRGNTVALQRLLIAAEAAKIELSRSEEVRIRVPCIAALDDTFVDLEDHLTRDGLERVTGPLVERTLQSCRDLLTQAKLEPSAVDELVFVGGMTRMPAIRRRLGELFPIDPNAKMSPDLGVVVGAALLASGDTSLIDVASMSVGVTLPGSPGLELVPANTPVPTVRRLSLPRPPSDRTLVMGFYEAVEATSLERDTLGTVRVDAAWLTKNTGALTLEAWLAADSELTLFLDAQGGQKLPLQLKEAPPPARVPAPTVPSAPAKAPARGPAGPGFRSLAFSTDADARGEAPILEKMQARARQTASTRPSTSGVRATDDEVNVPRPGDTLGGYLLLDILGQGGMGTVYRAEHIRLGRRVALKMLRQRLAANPTALERFLVEARAINKIRHENIIEVTDLFETDDGRTCYIMELLEGRSLADALRRTGPPTVAWTLGVARQIAKAMVAVHDAQIVHRDLKPENIYVTRRGERDDFVKLLDFGVAKLTDGSGSMNESQAGVVVGTLEYMAPEQLVGQPADPRADIWSLGVCLYELVTGRVPYAGDTEAAILFAQLEGAPRRPADACPPGVRVPRELDELVLQCLEREPSRRPQTMREVRGRLEALVEQLVPAAGSKSVGPAGRAGEEPFDGPAEEARRAVEAVRPALAPSASSPLREPVTTACEPGTADGAHGERVSGPSTPRAVDVAPRAEDVVPRAVDVASSVRPGTAVAAAPGTREDGHARNRALLAPNALSLSSSTDASALARGSPPVGWGVAVAVLTVTVVVLLGLLLRASG